MTLQELTTLLSDAPAEVVVDVEHLPDVEPGLASLLGVALCWPGSKGMYIPLNHWVKAPSKHLKPTADCELTEALRAFLAKRTLMGWNIEHDRRWINECFNITSTWSIDGRVLLYLQDRAQNTRGYGLKNAQRTVLHWESSNDEVFGAEVEAAGGRLDNGDHYLGSVEALGTYAAADALSTLLIIEKLRPTADSKAHDLNRDYAKLLAECTARGTMIDVQALVVAKRHYENEIQVATKRIGQICAQDIATLEAAFLSTKLAGYKSEKGMEEYLANPSRHPRFNPNSSTQRSMLLHNVIGLPVLERTKGGRPKSDKNTIAKFDHPSARAFVELSKNEKLLQFTEQYIKHSNAGVIHFPHDTCATVSERLGGYAPYDLNMPFSSKPIMQAFRVRPGHVGIHMDLVSIEPCLIAGFSGDETMLKVYRDGLGDIYLDLCLELFPLEEANDYDEAIRSLITTFHQEYDTNAPPNTEQKEKFGKIRKIAKIIQLAVGYTGTKYTVAKNLTQAGFATSLWKADVMVARYWQRFAKVARLASQLKSLAEKRGYITGFYGRTLYIPTKQTKDALNRFGQFGGHAVLRDIVFRLAARATEVNMYPLLPDIHDSTSWEVPEENYEQGVAIFKDTIRRVNADLALPVEIRGEIKQFHSFYGLKNKED